MSRLGSEGLGGAGPAMRARHRRAARECGRRTHICVSCDFFALRLLPLLGRLLTWSLLGDDAVPYAWQLSKK
jgi:hypothetical protein